MDKRGKAPPQAGPRLKNSFCPHTKTKYSSVVEKPCGAAPTVPRSSDKLHDEDAAPTGAEDGARKGGRCMISKSERWLRYYMRHLDKEQARGCAYYWAHREEILAKRKAGQEKRNRKAAGERRDGRP